MNIKPVAVISLAFVCFLGGGCAPTAGFDSSLKSIVKPYRFSIVGWECKAVPAELNKMVFDRPEKVDDEVGTVAEYFSLTERIRTSNSKLESMKRADEEIDLASLEAELSELEEQQNALDDTVARIIGGQIKETLAEQGISNPFDKYVGPKASFPPLSFRLEKPPHLLVVSPRDRIESMREVVLQQGIGLDEIEDIETRVDELGVSSLMVGLEGFGGTYPSFVTDEGSLRFTIDTATEEWLHQYLTFKPLGFRYLLDVTGVARNYEIATMTETVAGMASKEIGSIVYEKYYSQDENGLSQENGSGSVFDFNREMREIRRAVDEYLAQGEIEQAEEFMEQKRQYLVSNGYYIRKLNQAYFAFHGTYADKPTSISPIGTELRQLRDKSTSLKEFLDTAAALTSRQDLIQSIK